MTQRTRDLPPDAVLLHIGPHKTGTSSIQGALAAKRAVLPDLGVHYPGRGYSHNLQAHWAVGRTAGNGRRVATAADWQRLCRKAARDDIRTVVSSEVFDSATSDQIPGIIDDLGGSRVHVVVTLRPLTSMLPSIWQQGVKARGTDTYESWLHHVLDDPTSPAGQRFWHRYSQDQLILRWMDVVGPDRMHVVVVDKAKPDQLFTGFEQLLALPAGTLSPPEDRKNRSLTVEEVELVRRINLEFDRWNVSAQEFGRFMRLGVIDRIKNDRSPSSAEHRIITPAWADEVVSAASQASLTTLASLGIDVVGDLKALVPRDALGADLPDPSPVELDTIPIDLAVHAAIGAVMGGVRGGAKRGQFEASNPRSARANTPKRPEPHPRAGVFSRLRSRLRRR